MKLCWTPRVNGLGHPLRGLQKNEDTIEIFKLSVEAYPEWSNAYHRLGEAHMDHGDKDRAIEAGCLGLVAVTKEMGDGDENHRAERCGREGVPETAAENSELHKNPAADEGAD